MGGRGIRRELESSGSSTERSRSVLKNDDMDEQDPTTLARVRIIPKIARFLMNGLGLSVSGPKSRHKRDALAARHGAKDVLYRPNAVEFKTQGRSNHRATLL